MVPWGFKGPLLPGTGIIEESPNTILWLFESLELDSEHREASIVVLTLLYGRRKLSLI